jgi:hypothetical protein
MNQHSRGLTVHFAASFTFGKRQLASSKTQLIRLPSEAFPVFSSLPERRVCGCSHEAEKNR